MTDAVIGHVSACEVKEQPISMCTDSLSETIKDPSIKKLKARAESVLKYCMEKDAANAEKKEREAHEAKANKIIQEMVDYLERKCN